MEEDDSLDEDIECLYPIRHELVATAARFLKHPRVSRRSAASKEAFLFRKGLNPSEIASAFRKAGLQTFPDSKARHSRQTLSVYTSKWFLLRDVCNAIVLLAGATYGIHYIFKKFVVPFMCGKIKRKSLEDSVQELNENVRQMAFELNNTMQSLAAAFEKLNERFSENDSVEKLRDEVSSLKAVIMSGRQFQAPTSSCGSQARLSQTTSIASSPDVISLDDIPPTRANYFSW